MCWWVVRVAVFTLKQSAHGNAGEEVWQLWRVMDEGSGDGTLLLFYSMVQPGWAGVSVDGGRAASRFVMMVSDVETSLHIYAKDTALVRFLLAASPLVS